MCRSMCPNHQQRSPATALLAIRLQYNIENKIRIYSTQIKKIIHWVKFKCICTCSWKHYIRIHIAQILFNPSFLMNSMRNSPWQTILEWLLGEWVSVYSITTFWLTSSNAFSASFRASSSKFHSPHWIIGSSCFSSVSFYYLIFFCFYRKEGKSTFGHLCWSLFIKIDGNLIDMILEWISKNWCRKKKALQCFVHTSLVENLANIFAYSFFSFWPCCFILWLHRVIWFMAALFSGSSFLTCGSQYDC